MSILYFLNPLAQEIQKISAAGKISTVLSHLGEIPDGIVIDKEQGHIYWTNMGAYDFVSGDSFENNGSLERCNLDGSQRITIIPRGSTRTPKQLTADWSAGKLYWCDREGLAIWRANLDGSQQELLLENGNTEEDRHSRILHPVGIALDTANGKLYWTQKGAPKAGEGRIFRMNIDIPNGESPATRSDIETLWENLPEPIDLHIAPGADTLYWTDRGKEPAGNTLNAARIPDHGEKGDKPTILLTGFHEAIGVTFDPSTSTIYATDLGGRIHYYSLKTQQGGIFATIEGGALTGITVLD